MKKRMGALALVAAVLGAGCAVPARHAALVGAALPDLVPVREFVADRQSQGGYLVSPDGKKLAWYGVDGTQPSMFVKRIGSHRTGVLRFQSAQLFWSADSRFLLPVTGFSGDENAHIYKVDTDAESGPVVDLTPHGQTVSAVVQVVDGGTELLIQTNRRDKKVFDLYRLDAESGSVLLVAENPGDVVDWWCDPQGRLRARVVQRMERRILQRPDPQAAGAWLDLAEWSAFDQMRLLEVDSDSPTAWLLSNRGRDKLALVRLDLGTGGETVVHAEAEVDLDAVWFSRTNQRPLAVFSDPGHQKLEIFDAALRGALARLATPEPSSLAIISADRSETVFTVVVHTAMASTYHLVNTRLGEVVRLGEDRITRAAGPLGVTKPVTLQARDGETLQGYLTRPAGAGARPLPTVLMVHGGPWMRDRWADERRFVQFLANRGYAVLRVNYRGSSGYGRRFQDLGRGEFAGKMHDDLVDATRWAVEQGIADPHSIAIHGASYGGYAALVGLSFTPQVFACGIDLFGMSDLARFVETVPLHWELGKPWWFRFVGDPAQAEERLQMNMRSPLYRAGQVAKPLLIMHGANDPRVQPEQSELMAAALRRAGRPVELVLFPDEGHGFGKWTHQLVQYRKTEDFLARCLGGRSSGFDYYQLGAWAF